MGVGRAAHSTRGARGKANASQPSLRIAPSRKEGLSQNGYGSRCVQEKCGRSAVALSRADDTKNIKKSQEIQRVSASVTVTKKFEVRILKENVKSKLKGKLKSTFKVPFQSRN